MAQFAVIGLGSFGETVARQLAMYDHEVLGIDTSKKIVEDLAQDLTYTVVADASDEEVLKELNLQNYDAVIVAIGEDIEASILSVLHLKMLGVKKLWGVAKTHAHHLILTHLGIDKIIHPEQDMGMRVANALNYPIVSRYMMLGHGHFMVKIKIIKALAGLPLLKLMQKETEVKLILLKRGANVIDHIDETINLEENDIVVLEGTEEALKKLYKTYIK